MKPKAGLIVGRRAVVEALERDSSRAGELLLEAGLKSPALGRIMDLARKNAVKVRKVERRKLDELAQGASHQGVGLYLTQEEYTPFEDLLDELARTGNKALVVVADHLEDPHNLGAVIRSAAAVGAQGVIIPKDRACALTPAVAKAAAGGLSRLAVSRVTNLTQALQGLKKAGLWALALATRGAEPPWNLDLNMPLALVVGSEHKGVGDRLLKECDLLTTLPLAPAVESLNASVAAGVVLFEVVRQRS
ncbi:23S rRNA (guanosine(2251)-2'-O)-methyltransferase RlmB [Dethiosulfatarculus sandiegensis]|uniref:23S rRNA (guanosine(2251)-2'-O)-methyltransferase RlmB n=1 Tax=Dethiosulfatarculus sandiegensis TaxID=1429043 RepID=UPI000A947A7B|nr:23S rRNA (guanosine(2251)-2'-O)-methyltransferase RlmB [Dethiosulfatarculus sandiegensis]